MRIGIVGNGVVGNATGKAFECAHEVRYWDIVFERSTHTIRLVLECDIVFVCLPTPQKPNSLECDTSALDEFLGSIRGYGGNDNTNLVLRSTVPIGYTRRARNNHALVNLVHSPEFLTARTAEHDAANPTRLIIGDPIYRPFYTDSPCTGTLRNLYTSSWPGSVPILTMTSDESEAVKLFQNSFSAVKVAVFNEMRCLSDQLGLSWERCRNALLAGGWINPAHTEVPGPDGKRGFGGSCLPKDLANFVQCCNDAGLMALVAQGAYTRNEYIDRKELGQHHQGWHHAAMQVRSAKGGDK